MKKKISVIRIKNIKVNALIGVYELERRQKQDLFINMKITYDGLKASGTDKIVDTLNYLVVTRRIVEEVSKTEFELLESLMDFVFDIIMDYPQVISAEVEIDKPYAMKELAESVSVTGFAQR